jgi:YD repeat-containing protein
MKTIGRVLVLGFTLYAFSFVSGAMAAVGRTPGSFSVANTGAATYTIPIWAPPGPKGMQPNIALVYNSQEGNGYLGVGWNLSGLSFISRCNLTFAQDAAPAPVSLLTGDGYCLDGQRLRLTSGTYGTAGSTYQTEIANFSNVTAYGAAGNGPAYFIVQTADGHTLQYGNGGNSQVLASGSTTALSWMLNEVSDTSGNTMSLSYTTDTGIATPNVISWTPTSHGASSYAYTMTFAYGTNSVPTAGYVAGTAVQNPQLLSSITVAYSGTQVKQYILTYQPSGTTGLDRLTQVQECAASSSNCIYATTVNYQNGSAGVTTSPTTAINSPLSSAIYTMSARYDFNGDGYTDLVYLVGTTWYVAFGSANGYGTPVNTGITGGMTTSVLFGDLVGAGQAGILANHSGTWWYYTWNGNSFSGVTTDLAFNSSVVQFALVDINGDGLPDLVALYGGSNLKTTTRLNTSSGGTPLFSSTEITAFTDSSQTWTNSNLITPDLQYGATRAFDFNGDGRQDLVIQEVYCVTSCTTSVTLMKELISQAGGTFSAFQLFSTVNPAYLPTGYVTFADLNDDACTDTIFYSEYVYIAGCNGGTAGTFIATYPVVAVMDWNGDGLPDLIENGGGTLYVQLATVTGFGAATTTSMSYSANCTYLALDANGDGLDDLGCLSTSAGSAGFEYYLHNGIATPPDLLSSISDGYGNSASPTYSSIVRNNYTAGSGTYPDVQDIWPLYVVNAVTYSDPSSASGGTYSQTFAYYHSFMNVQGRGWDGFYDYGITDSRTGLTEWIGHGISFPYTSLPYFDDLFSGSQEISQTVGTQAVITLSSAPYQQIYFPYSSNVTTENWEFGGTENGDLITTTSTNYTFDNYGNATTIARTTTDNDPGSALHGNSWTVTTTNTPDSNTSTWCLNLLTETQVTFTASVGSTVTRTKQFTPDTTNCRYTQIVTEPSSTAYKVTEAFGFDSFGNIINDAVTGVGITPTTRTTTANWGTTGQFPMSVTDPSGAKTQFNYNFSYGTVSSKTDPNNLTTTWLYGDGFGRKTQQTRPDDTYTAWTYVDASTWTASRGLIVETGIYSNSGTSISTNFVVYDPLNRQVISSPEMLANYSRTDTRYDSLGRVAQQSFPCVFSTWAATCTNWRTISYDALNRVTQVQRPISSTNSTLQTTGYTYAGRTSTITDANGHAKTLVQDVNGWLRKTEDATGYAVILGYDAAGSKTSTTDSVGNALWSGTYQYGIGAFLVGSTDTDLGSWTYTSDALGELTGWTDAKGQIFSATYDALGRRTSRSEPDLYSAWTWGTSAAAHEIGQLHSVCTGTGANPSTCNSGGYSESETYDGDSRLASRSIVIPSDGTYTYGYSYDSASGLLDALTYPTVNPTGSVPYALQIKYAYQNGVLQSLTDISDSPNVALWTANTENPRGQLIQETLGNGVVVGHNFDPVTGWPTSVTAGVGGGAALQNNSYLFDEVGNLV